MRRLEPRIVFDGAALATAADAPDAPAASDGTSSSHHAPDPAPLPTESQIDSETLHPDAGPSSQPAGAPSEIVFIDSRIADAELLVEGLSENAEVHFLDADGDGLSQISDILSQRSGLTAIHIFSHGDEGRLFLGNSELNAGNIGDNAEALSGWGEALTGNGDLLLWGCDVAAGTDGARFVSELSAITGADVAASIDATGAAAKGGNWILETSTGEIEAGTPFGLGSLMAYAHLLNTAPQIGTGGAVGVNEDTALSFSGANQITVADIDNDMLTMTLTVANGTLTLAGTANLTGVAGDGTGTVTFQGLAADVTNAINGMTYQGNQDFNGSDTLSIQANDGTASSNSSVSIAVAPVEDAPQLVSNSITVTEGNTPSPVTIQTANLQVTDAESGAADLTYSLISLPSDGVLRVNGAAATLTTTFTQADIDAGRVTYTHNGAENATDSFVFNVTDGAGETLGNTTFTVTVTPVDDPLVQDTVKNGTVAEGAALTIDASLLKYTDVDTPDGSLVYTVTAASLAEGTLTVNGVAIGIGGTFTQADINNSLVVYTHNGDEPAVAQSFGFSVTDGTTTGTGTIAIAVTPVNDVPVAVVNPLTVAEGGSASFSAATLNIVDPDNTSEQITYKIASLPANGTLTLNGNAVVVGTTFSQAQIANLAYTHNGSETTSDSFTFTVRDGAGGAIAATAAPITIAPVNDQVSATGSATIFEGQSGSITLNISDNDDAAADITVRIDSLPSDGTLFLDGVAIGATGFTFSATQAGLLTYTHDGNDGVGGTPPDTSFAITVTDNGGGTATPSSVSTTVNIDIVPVNDDPTLPVNTGATIAEGGTLTIQNAHLSAADVDSPTATLTYQVESLTSSGVLLLNGVQLGIGSTFTQADIDAGNLQYVNHSETAGNDSFTFTLRDGQINVITGLQGALRDSPGGALAVQTFDIAITEVPDAPVLTVNASQALPEDGTATITAAALNATDVDSADTEIIFTITTTPANGAVQLSGVTLGASDTFTLDDVKNGRVTYVHTGGEPTGADSFQFQLTDSSGVPEAPATHTHSFFVTSAPAIPDNSGPGTSVPTETTNSGLTVQEHGTVSLTGALEYSDNVAPGSLVYVVTADASFGRILLNGVQMGVGSQFTQADIDAGNVTYESDGSNDTHSTQTDQDSFQLTLIDGEGASVTGITVAVTIMPVNDAPTVTAPSAVTADEDVSVSIAGVSIADVDEDATPGAELRVILAAGAGTLTLGSTAGLTFSSGDGSADATMIFTGTRAAINAALATLSYVGNANVNGTDTITITANDQGNTGVDPSTVGTPATGDATSEEGSANITVTIRAVNDGPTVGTNAGLAGVPEGATATITTAMLQGNDVDNPATEIYYVITALPEDGVLRLNGAALAVGGFFTQDDIDNNRVTYAHNGTENFRDTFTFTLSDGSSSSSAGNVFDIEITPVNDTPTVPTNVTLALAEGATQTITAAHLAVADVDGSAEIGLSADTLTFTITTMPDHGTILVDGVAYAGQALTNAMIAAGRVAYQHDGSENFTDSMAVTVDDNTGDPAGEGASTATATFNFKIAPLNDDPVVGNNVPLVVDEGGSGTISAAELSAIDPDNNDRQVQFRITSDVATGTLFLNGKAIGVGSAFTLEDIRNDLLTYTHNGDEVYADSFNFTIEDGGGGSDSGTYNITVNPINDTPTLTVPGAMSVDEDTNLSITGIVMTDDDAGSGTGNADPDLGPGDNEVSATLSVSNGTITLAQTTGLSFTSGADGSASMTIQGTLANVNAAIAALVYRGASNFHGSDTLDITVSDRGNFGADPGTSGTANDEIATGSVAITVNPINDAPTVTTNSPQTVIEDQTLTLSGADAIVIDDVDANLTAGDTLTVTVSATSGTLTLATTAGLTGISGDGAKTVTFTGSLAEVNAALDGLVYAPDSDFAGTDTINVSVNDNGNTGTGGAKTGSGSLTVNVSPVNDRPDIAIPADQTAPEDTTLVFSAANGNLIEISDVDAGTGIIEVQLSLSGATPGSLTLSQTTGLTFTSGADGSAAMTIEGTLANINAALSGMTYQGPLNANGFTTTLSVHVNDNGNTGSDPGTSGGPNDETRSASFDISVPSVNDAPTVSAPGAQTATEDDPAGVTFGNIGFADVDADPATDVMTVTLTVANGTLTLSGDAVAAAATVSNNGTATVTLTGTLNQLNAALNAAGRITYVSDSNFNGADPMSISINDGGQSGNDPSVFGLPDTGDATSEVGTGIVAINVTAVNDAPTITAPGAQSVNEDTNLVFSSGNGNQIQIADIDSGSSNLTATLTVSNGTLTANGSTAGLAGLSGQGTGTLTLTGTVSAINTAIASLTYRGTPDYNGADTIDINVNDNGNSGVDPSTVGQPATGTATDEQANASIAITVNPINDTPTVTVPGQQVAASASGVTFSAGNGNRISVADVDANEVDPNATVSITLSVTSGTLTLSTVDNLAFTAGDGAADTAMAFTGTLADVNAALNGLVFLPGGDQNASATLSLTINDQGNVGADPGLTADGSSEAATGTVTILMSEINDAPTIAAPAGPVDGTEDTVLAFTGANQIQIDDVDAFDSPLRVTLSVSNGTLSLTQTAGLTFTTGDGTSDATMVFTGTLTSINNALATLTYLGNDGYNSGHGGETLSITVNDQGSTGVDPGPAGGGGTADGSSEEATKAIAISIQAVNDTPTVTVPGAQTVNEDTNLSVTGISVADSDVAETPGGEVRVTLGVTNGTLTLAQTTGLSTATGDGTGSITIQGSAADVNAAIATLIYRGTQDYNGADTITVTVNDLGNTGDDPGLTGDGSSEEATATVAVTVTPINDTPTIAVPGAQSVDEDTDLVIAGVSFDDVDAGSGTVTATLSVANGTITLSQTDGLVFATGDGTADAAMTFSGTLDDVNAAIASLTYRGNADYHGADTLQLTINDGGNTGADPGLTGTPTTEEATASVAITVNPVNDAPTVPTPFSATTPEDTQITVNLTTGAADVDGGTGVGDAAISSYTVQTLPDPAEGTLFLADGTTAVTAGSTLTPAQAAALIFKPAPDFNGGPVTFTYIATDSDGASSGSATGSITVTPVNDTPTATVPGAQSVDEDTDLVIAGVSFDDVDAGSGTVTATLSVTSGTITLSQTDGLVFATGDGTADATMTFSGTLDDVNAAIASLTYRGNADFHGSDTLQLTINDGGNTGADPGLTGTPTTEEATASVAITVNPVNDPPVVAPFSTTTPENVTVLVSLTATDPDGGSGADDAGVTSITVTSLPPASQGILTLSDGTTPVVAGTPLTPSQAADLRFVPETDFDGTVTFEFMATDTAGATSGSATATVIVTPINTAPSVAVSTGSTVNEGQSVTIGTTELSVTDPDNTAAQITYTVNSLPANGSIMLNGVPLTAGQTFTQDDVDNGRLTYDHDGSETTSDSFNVTAADPGGLNTGGFNVPIVVNPVNDTPTVAVPGAQTTDEDTALAIPGVSISDADAGGSDVTVTVSSPNGSFSVTATGGLTSAVTNASGALVLTGTVANVNAALATLSYLPGTDYNGADTITIVVNDLGNSGADPSSVGLPGTGGPADEQASATIAVTVNPVDDIPVPITTPGTPDITLAPGEPFNGLITDYFYDPDGGPYVFGIDVPPSNGTLVITDPATGAFTYTPDPGFEGTDTFTFSVDGATIPFPTPVLVNVTILVQNLNISFINPSTQQSVTGEGGGDSFFGFNEGSGNGLGRDLNPRQIGMFEDSLNLQFDNEYIRAIVEDQPGAIDVQYGVGAAGEYLGESLRTPTEGRNTNATIVEVNLQASGGRTPAAQFLSLGSLETAAGDQQPVPPEDENEENAEEDDASEVDTAAQETGDDVPAPDDTEETPVPQAGQTAPVPAPVPQEGQAPAEDVPGQQGMADPASDMDPTASYFQSTRFSDQLAAEAGRMEQERLSLLAAMGDIVARAHSETTAP